MGRCAVLIDGGYLNKVCENEYNKANLHFGLLSNDVVGTNSERLRTYYYHCMPYQSNPPTSEEQQRHRAMSQFIFNLEKMPRFQFRQGKLQKIQGTFRQKRVDILFAVDLVRLSATHQIDRVVLFTGDSDMAPAIEVAKDEGVVVQIYYSPKSIHDELLKVCDERFEITKTLIDKWKVPAAPVAAIAGPPNK